MSFLNKLLSINRLITTPRISQSISHATICNGFKVNRCFSTANKIQENQNKNEEKSNQFSGFIPMDKIDITFSRSTGAGGQNVNKVNTKVDLRFHVATAEWLSNETKSKILEEYKTRINKDGYLVIKSDVTRYQQMNIADALEKLRTMIRDVEKPPTELSEETLEKIRRRQERAARERLMIKRQVAQTKRDRQAPVV